MPKTKPSSLIPKPVAPLDQRIALSISDAASVLGISQSQLRILISKGVFTVSRVAGPPRLNPEQIKQAMFGGDEV